MPPISAPARYWRAQRFAIAAIAASFALDVLIKRLFLSHAADWNGKSWIPGLLGTHYAWNHGVSFSLFWQSGSFGAAALAALLTIIIVVLGVAAFRTAKPLLAAGLGVIVGGALGNVADRYQHGAVFDFLVLRLGPYPLFVCNSADIFISLGVILIAADALLAPKDAA